jgi:hypothetical protein
VAFDVSFLIFGFGKNQKLKKSFFLTSFMTPNLFNRKGKKNLHFTYYCFKFVMFERHFMQFPVGRSIGFFSLTIQLIRCQVLTNIPENKLYY